ncbi:MAG: DUF2520 domain-containing protein, partial [Deltaproteobacteria bacterium]|nr:DUF2520 domain-containing protein [Deltaproteobacteria bacterium]
MSGPRSSGTVLILGRGKVGRGLTGALMAAGVDSLLRSARRPRRADISRARLVVLAVPDHAIVDTTLRVAPQLPKRSPLLHCAGAQPADLAKAAAGGRPVGAMHPLVSFADPRRPPTLTDTTFVIAGDAAAVRAARELALALGARPLTRPVHGPAYHAAAALVA